MLKRAVRLAASEMDPSETPLLVFTTPGSVVASAPGRMELTLTGIERQRGAGFTGKMRNSVWYRFRVRCYKISTWQW